MKIAIITNIREQKGLWRDSQVLGRFLLEENHHVTVVDFRDDYRPTVDLTIHLEVVEPRFFLCSPRHWWIPNPDWTYDHFLDSINRFELILCKTHNTERIFSRLSPKTVFTGFTSEDRYQPATVKEKLFFHACNDSLTKGTDAVLAAHARMNFPLYVPKGISDDEMALMQNRCLFHLQPSAYEGFGQILWESMSCGSILVSTDHPPMNEFDGVAKKIKPVLTDVVKLAHVGIVNPEGVMQAVEWCKGLSDDEIETLSKKARESYLKECERFKTIMRGLLK